MKSKLTRAVGLALLAVLIAGVPGLGGCGDEEETKGKEIIVGFMGDFTGPAAATCSELHKGLTDYFDMVEEDDPIAGVRIKVITYDTRMDYSRGPGGYQWLKGQGSDIFFNFSPIFQEILMDKHQEDEIPSFTFASSPELVDQEWVYSFSIHYPWEIEAIVKWIVEDWEARPTERAVKIGHIGVSGYASTGQASEKLQELLASPEYDFDLVEQISPRTETTYTKEIGELEDSDIIIVNLLGPQTAGFLKAATARGYDGTLLGTSLAFLGFWNLVKMVVTQLEDLDGALALQTQLLMTDDAELVDRVRANLQRFRPDDADALGKSPNYLAAQSAGMILSEVIRGAVAEVGAVNVDSEALNNALQNLDVAAEGYGESLKFRGGSNILHRMVRVIEYRVTAAGDDWYELKDWYLPPSFQ